MKRRSLAASILAILLLGALLGAPVLAQDKAGKDGFGYGYRPGWGYGDTSHIHTGPPGQTKENPGESVNESDSGETAAPGDVLGDEEEDRGQAGAQDDDSDEDPGNGKSQGQGKKKGHEK